MFRLTAILLWLLGTRLHHRCLSFSVMPPNQRLQVPSLVLFADLVQEEEEQEQDASRSPYRIALLGTGMMGQEHISYLMGFPNDFRIDFLCDPYEKSLEKSLEVMRKFQSPDMETGPPTLCSSEEELIKHAEEIDLLVIATPNYLHTDAITRWGRHPITILVEKPVAVSRDQLNSLEKFSESPDFRARVWVAMEYRFIPAIAKLLSLLPEIGTLKMVTIRENRYPFLHKIGNWNRFREKTGDTLVEKCCHFFDLFRLITGSEACLSHVRALAQRGLNYADEPAPLDLPIIDAAYVFMPFRPPDDQEAAIQQIKTMTCLELCMYAEGSRHQEEIIVTGTKGRLEAYLPENKVYFFERPSNELWSDRSVPPPPSSIRQRVFDCSDVRDVHGIENEIPVHGGYHYSSTAVEWYQLLAAMRAYDKTGTWRPGVSLEDGLRAVEIALQATDVIANEQDACGSDSFHHAKSMPV